MSHPSLGHRQTARYARSGIFKGLSDFAELERRIQQLPTEQERGDAFEVFAEAYLNVDEVAQAHEVWVGGRIPRGVLKELNLPSRDFGADGVYRSRLGDLVPYQVKFRTDRAPLPYRELSTFFGITEKDRRRVVITNSVAIAEVANSRANFNAVRGTDLDRLDAAQLARIAALLEGIRSKPQPRRPLPHQQAALADIEKELAIHDRATVVMACGTGKTLVALWAAERIEPKSVLVLVPSLALLRQTLHEWAKWTNWDERFRYLCVCSDPTVATEDDEIEVRPEDADFPVRTDPEVVSAFLRAGARSVSVVFCTYQSASVVGEAMQDLPPFDLGIFDEAHKTVGRDGSPFGFALKDKNLAVRKRLFLTATPRHYNIRKRDQEGDFAVSSMEDEAIYGRVAHRLTFGQAAAQKIIVPYKVVISVVDSAMIDNALLDQSEVMIKGDPVRAKWVAHQVALKRAVEEHDLKRVITFHSSINAAKAFAADGSEGVGSHLPSFQRFHVSGKQPTADREEEMIEFARVDRGVITNARCLTEGVDVPSVDMVAFMNPRRSKVDIVQAVGRAMRISGAEKTCGYVLIPLFLEQRKGESLAEALERSDFEEIAQVLNAMRDNDEELSDIIQALIVEKGRTGGFDESRVQGKVEVLGPQIRLQDLTAAIRTQLVLDLATSWDERYGQLLSYKEIHGDCNVPATWKHNRELGQWCSVQRRLYKTNRLSVGRIARLEQLGFVWDQMASWWEEMFGALREYKQVHGDCNVPSRSGSLASLGKWCQHQRSAFGEGRLSSERISRLEALGFVWDPLAKQWDEMFSALSTYKEAHGDCSVPATWRDNPELGRWCGVQRKLRKSNSLSVGRTARLEQLGFMWDPLEEAWQSMYAALSAYKDAHGDCSVPQGWVQNRELGSWCANQRNLHRAKKLTAVRVTQLEQLGFVWEPQNAEWEEMFSALHHYREEHGNCNVPLGVKDDLGLGAWCANQRTRYRGSRLAPDRVARLETLGFVWDQMTSWWEEMFAALGAYKDAHGDCDVPARWKANPQLAKWAQHQRTGYKNKTLNRERRTRLEALGFPWDPFAARWDEMFKELLAHKETQGHSNVPGRSRENPRLGRWCADQRKAWKARRLTKERQDKLKAIGFRFEGPAK